MRKQNYSDRHCRADRERLTAIGGLVMALLALAAASVWLCVWLAL